MATPTALRVTERQARVFRHTWRGSAFTVFLSPALYLIAMGLGLGTLVDDGGADPSLGGVSYLVFLAPGLLAASAMQAGAGEGSWPVMAGIKWIKSYDAQLATPIGVGDLLLGHFAWVAVRIVMMAAAFVIVSVTFGAMSIIPGTLAILPAVLTGMAFAAPITAYTATLDSDYGLSNIFRFGVVPLFLFSGTFFPITQLPGWMQTIAVITPLWHGVELTRAVALQEAAPTEAWISVMYLAAWVAAGSAAAVITFRRRLIK